MHTSTYSTQKEKDESTIKETSKTLITNYFNITGNNVYENGDDLRDATEKKGT